MERDAQPTDLGTALHKTLGKEKLSKHN